jgi:hypothetical protein
MTEEILVPIPIQEETKPVAKINWAKYHTITNIILIIVILAIGIYVIIHIQEFLTLGKDVCKLCEISTNATCLRLHN